MSLATLETLPNEILILIIQYSGNVLDILRTYLGLNQRFNSIVLDRQLHVLADYSYAKPVSKCYNSDVFQQATSELMSIRTSIDEGKLVEMLQPFLGSSIRQRYLEMAENNRLLCGEFQSVRQTLSENEVRHVDQELQTEFNQLKGRNLTMRETKRIQKLVLTRGARFPDICGDYNLDSFLDNSSSQYSMIKERRELEMHLKFHFQIIEMLVISNPDLIDNRFFTRNFAKQLESFLLYHSYRWRMFGNHQSCNAINREYNRILLDAVLLILHWRSKWIHAGNHFPTAILDIFLETKRKSDDQLYIRTVQTEMIKFILEQYSRIIVRLDVWINSMLNFVRTLVKGTRLDLIEVLCHEPFAKHLFQEQVHVRKWINTMIGTCRGTDTLDAMTNNPKFAAIASRNDVFFVVLDRQDRHALEKLLNIFPDLVNAVDEKGNNALSYFTLKNPHYPYRIIRMLIRKGCDPMRKNIHGQTFRDVLQLPQNRTLLINLIQRGTIHAASFQSPVSNI